MSADKITLIPRVVVKEGRVEEFVEGFVSAAKAVRAEEPGCFAYSLYRRKDNPREFIIFEQYGDDKALAAHMAHLVALFGPPGPNSGPIPEKLADFFEASDMGFYEEVVG